MSDRIGTTEARLEGFYWVILGQNPPEIAYWERGEWWLAGEARPWHPEAVDRCQRSAGVQAAVEAGCVIGMSFRIRPFPDDEWPEWSHPPWYAPLIACVIGLLPIIAGLALVVWLVKKLAL